MEELETLLPRLSGLETLIFWGDKDLSYGLKEMNRLEALFPDHTTHVLEGVGHFIQDDAGEEIVSTIKEWWQGTGRSSG